MPSIRPNALAALLVVVLMPTGTRAQTSAPSPAPSGAWVDVAPGDAMADVRTRFGDPVAKRVDAAGVVSSRYLLLARSLIVTLYQLSDRVSEMQVRALRADGAPPRVTDPHGVSLGATEDRVVAARGAPRERRTLHERPTLSYENGSGTTSYYEFADGKVVVIDVVADSAMLAKLPAAAHVVTTDGDSIEHAILDVQATDGTTVDWEYVYLAAHSCNGDSPWKLKTQALIHKPPRVYDQLDVVCPPTGSTRTFFFDITAGFGKL